MLNSSQTFFSSRPNRGMLEFVVSGFPFPLALTYARLHDEMDRQEPIAAAWQLRDAFECLLKFTACLAVAGFLNAKPDPSQASNIVSLLMKPQGLSLGDWHTLLERALQGSHRSRALSAQPVRRLLSTKRQAHRAQPQSGRRRQ